MRTLVSSIALILSFLLIGCDAVDTLSHGFEHGEAVSKSLLEVTGEKPVVNFNAFNGTLSRIDIVFKKPPQKHTLAQIKELAKTTVAKEFKQKPASLVVSFSFETSAMPD